MPAERFYIDAPLTGEISLEGNEFHHLVNVMRIRVGEEIELVNGKGALATAQITQISKHKATIEILTTHQHPVLIRHTLAVPLMRPAKLELVIEKCTELGASAFHLYPAQYSEKDELSSNQLERLHHIAISAMKQCGRLDLPPIQILSHFEDLFKTPSLYLFGDTRKSAPKITSQEKATFISGPERGFSEKEHKILDQKAQGVKLHQNILRAETAPIAAICLL